MASREKRTPLLRPDFRINVPSFLTRLLLLLLGVIVCSPVTASQIVDKAGRQIDTSRPFTRIISLYSAHTENICSLGAAPQLVGISTSADYPPEILDRTRFSYRDDAEKFIAAKPDLVLIRPMIDRAYPQFIAKLENGGITVVSLQPNTIEEMFSYWRQLGQLTGHPEQADQMVNSFQKSLEERREQLADIPVADRPRVYFEAIHAKMKTFARHSIAIFVLEQAGGINMGADAQQVRTTNIAWYGKEKLLSHGPEIDIFLAQQGRMNPITVEEIKNEPGFMAIKAVQDDRIYLIDEPLVARPTMRILEGITQLNELFFKNATTPSRPPQ